MQLFYRLSNIATSKSIALNSVQYFLHLQVWLGLSLGVCVWWCTMQISSSVFFIFVFYFFAHLYFLSIFHSILIGKHSYSAQCARQAMLALDDFNNNKQDASRDECFSKNGCIWKTVRKSIVIVIYYIVRVRFDLLRWGNGIKWLFCFVVAVWI